MAFREPSHSWESPRLRRVPPNRHRSSSPPPSSRSHEATTRGPGENPIRGLNMIPRHHYATSNPHPQAVRDERQLHRRCVERERRRPSERRRWLHHTLDWGPQRRGTEAARTTDMRHSNRTRGGRRLTKIHTLDWGPQRRGTGAARTADMRHSNRTRGGSKTTHGRRLAQT